VHMWETHTSCYAPSVHPNVSPHRPLHKLTIQVFDEYYSELLPAYRSTTLLLDLDRFFLFLVFYTVSRTSWTGDQPFARPLPAQRTARTQNKRTIQTCMP
jgi:hypothetical protein